MIETDEVRSTSIKIARRAPRRENHYPEQPAAPDYGIAFSRWNMERQVSQYITLLRLPDIAEDDDLLLSSKMGIVGELGINFVDDIDYLVEMEIRDDGSVSEDEYKATSERAREAVEEYGMAGQYWSTNGTRDEYSTLVKAISLAAVSEHPKFTLLVDQEKSVELRLQLAAAKTVARQMQYAVSPTVMEEDGMSGTFDLEYALNNEDTGAVAAKDYGIDYTPGEIEMLINQYKANILDRKKGESTAMQEQIGIALQSELGERVFKSIHIITDFERIAGVRPLTIEEKKAYAFTTAYLGIALKDYERAGKYWTSPGNDSEEFVSKVKLIGKAASANANARGIVLHKGNAPEEEFWNAVGAIRTLARQMGHEVGRSGRSGDDIIAIAINPERKKKTKIKVSFNSPPSNSYSKDDWQDDFDNYNENY